MNKIDRACSLLADVSSVKNIDATAARQAKSLKRVEYLKRLATFKTLTWFAKPEPLSSMHCARHGWTNSNADTLYCTCGASIVVRIDDELDVASVENITNQYEDQLKYSHDCKCFWYGKPLSVDILHGPNAADARALLSGRLNDLVSFAEKTASALPQYKEPGYSLSRALKEHLDATQRQEEPVTQDMLSMFLLALCGWSIASASTQGTMLQCVCCQMKEYIAKNVVTILEVDSTMDEHVPGGPGDDRQSTALGAVTNKRAHADDSVDAPNKRCKTTSTEVDPAESAIASADQLKTFNPTSAHRGHCPFYLTGGTLFDLSPTRSSPLRAILKPAASGTAPQGTPPPHLGALEPTPGSANGSNPLNSSLFSIWDSARTMVGSALALLDASTSPTKPPV
eukprot:m.161093 g.161093  ORF g.161093 m.161093 type:complete len:397 (+) comp18046_c0_seq5:166-1356(+)